MNFLTTLLFKIQSVILAADTSGDWQWVSDLIKTINNILAPVLGIAAAAGSIYAIVIGIKMARADSEDKRSEAKKRLISVITAVVVVVVLIVFFTVFFPMIIEQVTGYTPTPATEGFIRNFITK